MDIISEIKILTGVPLMELKEVGIQIEVLKRFMLSSPQFAGLTTNEVRHAFYLNNQGEYDEVYRHFNKVLNAEFVGDVLRAYVKYKTALYRKKAREIKLLLGPAVERKEVPIPNEIELQQMIQHDYNNYLAGSTEFIYLYTGVYKLLRKYGGIQIHSRQYWHKLIGYAIQDRIRISKSTLFRKDVSEKDNILRLRGIYETYEAEGWIPSSEYRMVIYTLQKKLYFRFLKTMAYFNIKDIFKEVKITK